MSYLIQTNQKTRIKIGGTNYSDYFISFTASDASANRNGLVSTTGSVVLAQVPEGRELAHYRRALFRRGEVVKIDTKIEGGSYVRHPRGYLYVISTSWDGQGERVIMEVGCRVKLAEITDDVSAILPYVNLDLDLAQQTVPNCAAAFQAKGEFLWQDNTGALRVNKFFDGDTNSTTAAGEWISALGVSTIDVKPMAAAGAVPDKIKLSWQVPQDFETVEEPLEEVVEVVNDYFISYPAVTYVRTLGERCFSNVPLTNLYRGEVRVVAIDDKKPRGTRTIDSIEVETGDLVLLTDQDNKVDNGIWQVNTEGDWERAGSAYFTKGNWVTIIEGVKRGGQKWEIVTDEYIIYRGQTKQEWVEWDSETSESVTEIACSGSTTTTTPETDSNSLGGCGNVPTNGIGSAVYVGANGSIYTPQPIACNANWKAEPSPTYVSVSNKQVTTTRYTGPSGQVASVFTDIYGPLVEVNPQFYADKFAYCASVNAALCDPNGSCSMGGTKRKHIQTAEVFNTYADDSNELIEQTISVYKTKFELAQPEDWRSGITDGVPRDFDDDFSKRYREDFILFSFVRIIYSKDGNRNVETTETYTSNAATGVGLKELKDALDGIKTVTKRTSRTITNLPNRPDTIKDVTTPTVEKSSTIRVQSDKYLDSPSEAGPYILEESIPVPLLESTPEEAQATADDYQDYLKRFTKGDAWGLQITEALREDIRDNWRPGMPFRYSDGPGNNPVLALRMDGCTWGLSSSEAIVTTNGIWIGSTSGNLRVESNLVGNTSPNMSSSTGRLPG